MKSTLKGRGREGRGREGRGWGTSATVQFSMYVGTYMDSGSVEAAKKAVRENTVPAGHPAFNM